MTARWHLGPITGGHFWWVLVTSPEVLVFLFFMITDPKTAPGRTQRAARLRGQRRAARRAADRADADRVRSKVALLGALAIVCAARPLLDATSPRRGSLGAALALAACGGRRLRGGARRRRATRPAARRPRGARPQARCRRSRSCRRAASSRSSTQPTARAIAHDLLQTVRRTRRARSPCASGSSPAPGQDPPFAVAQLAGRDVPARRQVGRALGARTARPSRRAALRRAARARRLPPDERRAAGRARLPAGPFRYGVTERPAGDDGRRALLARLQQRRLARPLRRQLATRTTTSPPGSEHGGLPTSRALPTTCTATSSTSRSASRRRRCRCAARAASPPTSTATATPTSSSRPRPNDVLLWNNGNGTFTEGARKAGIVSFGWHSGAAVADVNGDGRPDLFVAGYTDMQHPIPSSVDGLPDELPRRARPALPERGRAAHVPRGRRAGRARPAPYDHSLGAVFIDVNGDGRPDLYVANDEDPNRLYLNEPGGPLGFHFVDVREAARRRRRERRHGHRRGD